MIGKRYFISILLMGLVCLKVLTISYASDIFTTNDLSLKRPAVRCFKGIRYQPVELHLKFFDFDAGLMLYTESGKIKRPSPLMLFFAFNQPIRKFAGRRYYLNHSHITKPIIADSDKLIVTVRNKMSEDRLQFVNEKEKLVFIHSGKFLRAAGNVPEQAGIVIRLPVWIWNEGSWSMDDKSGRFHRSSKGFTYAAAKKLPIEIKSNSNITLNLPDNRGRVIIKSANRYDAAYYMNCSGNLGMFFDLFFVKNLKKGTQSNRADNVREDKFEMRFEGNVVPEIWRTFSLSKEKYESLKLKTLLPHPSFGQAGNMKLIKKLMPFQCMDKSNCFYGAIFSSSHTSDSNYWLDVPIQTRNFVYNLARQWHKEGNEYYQNTNAFERIIAGLDYLSTATTPFGQYGDIRLKGWTITPFLWGIMPVAESIYYIQNRVSPEKRQNWLAMLIHLYSSAEKHLRDSIDGHTGDGANLMTYAQQIFDLAIVLDDSDGKSLAHKGVHCAIEPEFHPKNAIRSDFSYRQGNLFDVGYYHWLVATLASYISVADGTRWALTQQEQCWLRKICEAFVWLYDNGLLNTMTSHPKNRLSLKPFPKAIADKMSSQVSGLSTICAQSYQWRNLKTNAEKEKFVSGSDIKLPMGQHWFSLAKFFIKRTPKYYASIWWNDRTQVRDFKCNSNYNAKIPAGAMYFRWLDAPREVTIPSDNIHYSGVVYLKDMREVKDWASGFENYKGSELLSPISDGDCSILAGKLLICSKEHPNRKIRCLKTVVLTKDELITFDTVLSSKYWRDVILEPVVLRRYIAIPQKIAINNKEIDMDKLGQSNKRTQKYQITNDAVLTLATTAFQFTVDNLVGDIDISKNFIDGSQRYSFYPPAKVIEVKFSPKSKGDSNLITRWQERNATNTKDNLRYFSSSAAHLVVKDNQLIGVIYHPCNISDTIKVNQKGSTYYITLKKFARIFVLFYQPAKGFDIKIDSDVATQIVRTHNSVIIKSR